MIRKQKGFTLPELLFLIAFVIALFAAGGLVYVAIHFIAKIW